MWEIRHGFPGPLDANKAAELRFAAALPHRIVGYLGASVALPVAQS